MIVVLPNMYDNFKTNIAFLNYWNRNLGLVGLYDENVQFYTFGNFPAASYALDKNNISELCLYSEMQDIIQLYVKNGCGLFFDCGSPLITSINYWDNFSLNALSLTTAYSDTLVSISTDYLYDYLKNKFPNINMVKSMIYTGEKKDIDFLYILKNSQHLVDDINKKQTMLYINNPCCRCKNYVDCAKQEMFNINLFSKESVYQRCNLYKQQSTNWCLDFDEMQSLKSQNYSKFILADYSFLASPLPQITEYINSLIKPEYRLDAINHILAER